MTDVHQSSYFQENLSHFLLGAVTQTGQLLAKVKALHTVNKVMA